MRMPLIGAASSALGLDGVEFADAFEDLAGDRRGTGDGEFIEAPADMSPTEGEIDVATLGEGAIATIAIDLQNALEAGQVSDRPFGLAVRRVDVSHAGRIGTTPRTIVAGVGPELADLGATASRIKHRRRGLVGEQLGRCLQCREQALMYRPQYEGGAADPVGQCRAVQGDALPGVDLSLAIERQMIGVFGDEHMRHRRLGRQPALDQSCRRGQPAPPLPRKPDRHIWAGARPARAVAPG